MRILLRKKLQLFNLLGTGIIILSFILNSLAQIPIYAQNLPNSGISLPAPGAMLAGSPNFIPPLLRGLKVHLDHPFRFDFIVDSGDSDIKGENLKNEGQKLIRYFLASLTIPEDEQWVNLSPYESDRIIPDELGVTELGRDLLAQDYLLKQLTASLMYPEHELGQRFWERIRQKAYEEYGTREIPMDTFHKVWIVPEKAVVYENGDTAFIMESRLRVMLEQDYVALEQSRRDSKLNVRRLKLNVHDRDNQKALNFEHSTLNAQHRMTSEIESQILRELILPELEREVNEGQHFAPLRQICYSMILATWYRQALQEHIFTQIYADQKKMDGMDRVDEQVREEVYQQYLEAYKQGVYDYIKEEYDQETQQMIPRKYFSGGILNQWPAAVQTLSPTTLAAKVRPFGRLTHLRAQGEPGSSLSQAAPLVVQPAAQEAVEPVVDRAMLPDELRPAKSFQDFSARMAKLLVGKVYYEVNVQRIVEYTYGLDLEESSRTRRSVEKAILLAANTYDSIDSDEQFKSRIKTFIMNTIGGMMKGIIPVQDLSGVVPHPEDFFQDLVSRNYLVALNPQIGHLPLRSLWNEGVRSQLNIAERFLPENQQAREAKLREIGRFLNEYVDTNSDRTEVLTEEVIALVRDGPEAFAARLKSYEGNGFYAHDVERMFLENLLQTYLGPEEESIPEDRLEFSPPQFPGRVGFNQAVNEFLAGRLRYEKFSLEVVFDYRDTEQDGYQQHRTIFERVLIWAAYQKSLTETDTHRFAGMFLENSLVIPQHWGVWDQDFLVQEIDFLNVNGAQRFAERLTGYQAERTFTSDLERTFLEKLLATYRAMLAEQVPETVQAVGDAAALAQPAALEAAEPVVDRAQLAVVEVHPKIETKNFSLGSNLLLDKDIVRRLRTRIGRDQKLAAEVDEQRHRYSVLSLEGNAWRSDGFLGDIFLEKIRRIDTPSIPNGKFNIHLHGLSPIGNEQQDVSPNLLMARFNEHNQLDYQVVYGEQQADGQIDIYMTQSLFLSLPIQTLSSLLTEYTAAIITSVALDRQYFVMDEKILALLIPYISEDLTALVSLDQENQEFLESVRGDVESAGFYNLRPFLATTRDNSHYGVRFIQATRVESGQRVLIDIGENTAEIANLWMAEDIVKHPNLLRVLDGGVLASGMGYAVYEFIAGDLLENMIALGETFTLNEAIDIFIQLIRALRRLHQLKMIHHEPAPKNIILKGKNAILIDPEESARGYEESALDNNFNSLVSRDLHQLGTSMLQLLTNRIIIEDYEFGNTFGQPLSYQDVESIILESRILNLGLTAEQLADLVKIFYKLHISSFVTNERGALIHDSVFNEIRENSFYDNAHNVLRDLIRFRNSLSEDDDPALLAPPGGIALKADIETQGRRIAFQIPTNPEEMEQLRASFTGFQDIQIIEMTDLDEQGLNEFLLASPSPVPQSVQLN